MPNIVDPTAPQGEGAMDAPTPSEQWNDMDWKAVEKSVGRLQARIAKAASEGKRGKARRLSYLSTHGHHAKALAVRRVTQNKGRRTPGIDGEVWSTDAGKMRAALRLTDRHYGAKPLRRANVPKKGRRGSTRPLGIPTMYDRAMQALYLLALDPIAETSADPNSFGFRRGRSAKDAGQYLFGALSRRYNARWVLEGDIKGCFDNIGHAWLMDNVDMDKAMLAQFIKAGYVFEGELFQTYRGTPQGGIISATLANLALDGIQEMLAARFNTDAEGGHSIKAESANKVRLCRYADDFVLPAATKEIAEEVRDIIVAFLAERGLVLSEEKTPITHIDEGFDFLGWNFRKYRGKLMIKPSKKSVKAITGSLHDLILRECRQATQTELVCKLNPLIAGWARYHDAFCSKDTFYRIDDIVYGMLVRWSARRHHSKGRHWISRRYWRPVGSRAWVFTDGDVALRKMGDIRIRRHKMVNRRKNPYLAAAPAASMGAAGIPAELSFGI